MVFSRSQLIFASHLQAMHSADQHLRMCGPFFKAIISKSQRRWLLITASCVYTSTLSYIHLILPRHSVSASTGWGCRGRRTAAVGRDGGDGGPGTTCNIERCGKLQKSSMVLWQRSRVIPFRFRPEFRIPEDSGTNLSCPRMIQFRCVFRGI